MGTKIKEEFPDRDSIFMADLGMLFGETIADGFSCGLGDVIGKITSSGKVRRHARANAGAGGFSTGSNTGTVADDGLGKADASPAQRFAAGDVLKLEDGTTIGTVDHVTAPATIVLTGNAAVDVQEGDAVLASDGSQTAIGITNEANDGVDDTGIAIAVDGILKPAKVRGLSAAAMQQMGGALMAGSSFKL